MLYDVTIGVVMTEKDTPKKDTPAKEEGEIYNFTQAGIVVRAKNLEEATELYKQTLKENKES